MKFIPILYSTPMVQALLEDRKTITRRIVKMPKDDIKEATWGYTAFTPERHISFRGKHANGQYGESFVKCPYGKKGDVLWVKEMHYRFGTWEDDEGVYTKDGKQAKTFIPHTDEILFFDNPPADGSIVGKQPNQLSMPHWYRRPSIFMPKWACRIWLKITDVRVERLHDISPNDAANEGIEMQNIDLFTEPGAIHADYVNYMWVDNEKYEDYYFPYYADPISSFQSLWYKINGRESWNANPWVWVISFEQIDKPVSFLESSSKQNHLIK